MEQDRLTVAEGLLAEALRDRFDVNESGDTISPKEACYCTDTGAGEFVDDKLTGDLLMCLPCKIRAFLEKK